MYATANHLRPRFFPRWRTRRPWFCITRTATASSKEAGICRAAYQDLEVFGLNGSVYMKQQGVELRPSKSKEVKQVPLEPLPPERAEPIAYMVHAVRNKKPIEGLIALDINVGVNEIIEAAKLSIQSGRGGEAAAQTLMRRYLLIVVMAGLAAGGRM